MTYQENFTLPTEISYNSMKSAHAIYQEAGFRKVDTPSDFPENLKPIVVFMEMALEGKSVQDPG